MGSATITDIRYEEKTLAIEETGEKSMKMYNML